jgi:hypothetical protein
MRIGRFGPLAAPLLLMQLRLRLGVAAAELKPVDHISSLRCPVLVIGGTDDQHTTAADTHLLFAAAAPPKELGLIIAQDTRTTSRAQGKRIVSVFLAFLPGAGSGSRRGKHEWVKPGNEIDVQSTKPFFACAALVSPFAWAALSQCFV